MARLSLRRLGTPEAVADVVAYLLFADARYVTGAIVPVDGGDGIVQRREPGDATGASRRLGPTRNPAAVFQMSPGGSLRKARIASDVRARITPTRPSWAIGFSGRTIQAMRSRIETRPRTFPSSSTSK